MASHSTQPKLLLVLLDGNKAAADMASELTRAALSTFSYDTHTIKSVMGELPTDWPSPLTNKSDIEMCVIVVSSSFGETPLKDVVIAVRTRLTSLTSKLVPYQSLPASSHSKSSKTLSKLSKADKKKPPPTTPSTTTTTTDDATTTTSTSSSSNSATTPPTPNASGSELVPASYCFVAVLCPGASAVLRQSAFEGGAQMVSGRCVAQRD
jgi:hypothetical protein